MSTMRHRSRLARQGRRHRRDGRCPIWGQVAERGTVRHAVALQLDYRKYQASTDGVLQVRAPRGAAPGKRLAAARDRLLKLITIGIAAGQPHLITQCGPQCGHGGTIHNCRLAIIVVLT